MSFRQWTGRRQKAARRIAVSLILVLVLQPVAVRTAARPQAPPQPAPPFSPFTPPPATPSEFEQFSQRIYDELIQKAQQVQGPRIIDDVTYPTYTIAGMVLTAKVYERQLMGFVSQLADLAKLTREQKIARIKQMMAIATEAQPWATLLRSATGNAMVRMQVTSVGRQTIKDIEAAIDAARARGDLNTVAFLEHLTTLPYDAMVQALIDRRLQILDQDPLLSVNRLWVDLLEGGDPAQYFDEFDAAVRAAMDQAYAEISRVRDINTVEGYSEFLKDRYARARMAAAALFGERSGKLIANLNDFAAAHESLRGTQEQVAQLEMAAIVGGIAVIAIFLAPAAALAGTTYVSVAEVGAAGLGVLAAGVQLVHDGQRLYAVQTDLSNAQAGQAVFGGVAVQTLRDKRDSVAGMALLDLAFAALSLQQFRAASTALTKARLAREAETLANAIPAGAAATTLDVTDAAAIVRRIDAGALKAHRRVGSAFDPAFYIKAGVGPQRTVQIGGQTFHLSAPFEANGRLTILAFQETGAGAVIPRTFYLSGEHGVWRVATGYSGFESLLLKGPRQRGGTFVNESAADLAAELQGPLTRWANEKPVLQLSDDAAERAAMDHLEAGAEGVEFDRVVRAEDIVEAVPRTAGAAPNFAAGPLDRWTFQHPLYGLVEGFTYKSIDGDILYVVIRDAQGRVFVPSIQPAGSTITGFGTRASAHQATDLTTTPLRHAPRGRGGYVDNPTYGNDLNGAFRGNLPPALPGSNAMPSTAPAAGTTAVQRGADRAIALGASQAEVHSMLRILGNSDRRFGEEVARAFSQIGELPDLMAAARRAGVPQAEIDAMLQTARAGGVVGLAEMPVHLLRAAANRQNVTILVDTPWDVLNQTGQVVVSDAPATRFMQFFRDTMPNTVLRTDLVALFNLRAHLSFLRNGRAVVMTPQEIELLRRVVGHPDAARMYAFLADERVLVRVFDEGALETGRRFLNAPNHQALATGRATLSGAAPAVATGSSVLLPGSPLVLSGRTADEAMARHADRAQTANVPANAPAPGPASTPTPPSTPSLPAGPPSVGSLPKLPDSTPLSGDYADGTVSSVRFALDDALQAAGYDMTGSFRTNAQTGIVTYEDGVVKVTARASGGRLLIAAVPDTGTTGTTGQAQTPMAPPIEFTIEPGARPEKEDESRLDLDDMDDAVSLNDPSVMTANTDDVVQAMIASLAEGGVLVVQPGARRDPPMLAAFGRRLLGALNMLRPGGRGVAAASAAFAPRSERRAEIWLAPIAGSEGSATNAAHPIRMVLTSLGASTGEAFEVQVINDGAAPVRLTGSLVLEPIAKASQAAVHRQLQRAVPRGAMTARLNAYCLEFLRQPPGAGTLFRIAPPEVQKKFASMRSILDASRKLREAGVLTPDSDPKTYFHAIRQWAIWTKAQKFTLDSFGKAFVEHTKKNVQTAGRPWTQQLEQALLGVVPGRWRDITRVLAEADATEGGGRARR